ncbi:MAG: F0F1 ATP synthase subunit gamma [Methyloprofundus sp.]|nr:F0F1 ATP synthase subunit gamma [Methyloprofundus sp.]MDT8426706.1 F0F1 ATP synthase subunit gamma [Methyloprofundus sp.]
MSQSRALQQHIAHLTEIRSILHSLKNMAFMDMHKLIKLRQAQSLVVQHIETVAADFLQFYPGLPELEISTPLIVITIGSERGFCGNFNESLIAQLAQVVPDHVIAVGSRLCARLQNSHIGFTALSGANSSEEISQVISSVSDAISQLHKQDELFNLSVLFHQDEHLSITLKALLPPFKEVKRSSEYKNEPLLNLPPAQFLLELIDQYVFSSLQDVLYISLAAENNQRLQHLDNAVRHLDEATEQLHKKSQIYRQEEITEEIEVILLNADNLEP